MPKIKTIKTNRAVNPSNESINKRINLAFCQSAFIYNKFLFLPVFKTEVHYIFGSHSKSQPICIEKDFRKNENKVTFRPITIYKILIKEISSVTKLLFFLFVKFRQQEVFENIFNALSFISIFFRKNFHFILLQIHLVFR